MIITRSVQKWGNSNAVRLPQAVLKASHVEIGQALEISLQGRSIMLTPVDQPEKITLDSLLVDVTPEKVGGELDWGKDAGLEKHE